MRRPRRCNAVPQTQSDMSSYERIDIMDPDTFVVTFPNGSVIVTDYDGACEIEPDIRALPRNMRTNGETPDTLDVDTE